MFTCCFNERKKEPKIIKKKFNCNTCYKAHSIEIHKDCLQNLAIKKLININDKLIKKKQSKLIMLWFHKMYFCNLLRYKII
jgi:hypothetical protein